MTDQQKEALAARRFNWAETPDHVWTVSPYHVNGLHGEMERELLSAIRDAETSDGPSPIGIVLQGIRGIGKTHLLGNVRQQVQREGGYFFLVTLSSGKAFWGDIAEAISKGLLRKGVDGELQLVRFLSRLCGRAGVPDRVANAVLGDVPVSRDDLDIFVGALRRFDRQIGTECGDTARALALYASTEPKRWGVGEDYLDGYAETEANQGRKWGLRARSKPTPAIVQEVSQLLALTGPSATAVDQLDT